MNAEIDKLLDESGHLSEGLIKVLSQSHLLLRSPHLCNFRWALQELAQELDERIAKIIELRSEAEGPEQTPKLSLVP